MDVVLLFAIPFGLFGLAMGSFGNVVIHRVPQGESIGGRSHCPFCGRRLSIIEIIPVISFIFLLGKCRRCGHRISWQYPVVELISGGIFVYAFLHALPSLAGAILLALCLWLLFLIAIIDARTGMIPDALNIPFVILAFGYSSVMSDWPLEILLAAGAATSFFALQWLASSGRWVGSGDIILATGIGAFLGTIPLLLIGLWFAYVSAAVVAVILLLRKSKTIKSRMVFGPFLAAGTFVSFAWGARLLSLLGF